MKKIILPVLVGMAANVFAQSCVPNTNSLSFNGTQTQYVSIDSQNNLNMTDFITVEAWIYPVQFGATSASGSIFCKHGWSSGESGYVLRAGDPTGILSFNFAGDSLGTNVSWKEVKSPAGSLTLNTWYHVAGTFDGNDLNLYINGTLVATTHFVGGIIPSVFNPKIGRLSDVGQGASRFWNGLIDEVRVFNRALSQAEISDSMGVQIDPLAQNGLVGYWRMNEGSGTILNDLSSSANSGTITGATYSTNVPFSDAPAVPAIAFISGQLVASSGPDYQWYLNGQPILVNGTYQTYLPTQNGSYTVEASNGICSTTSLPYNLTALGTRENDADPLISLSVNPLNNVLFVHLKNFSAMNDVEVTDITGKEVYIRINNRSAEFKIPTDAYAKGVYFLKVTGTGGILTKRFMIE